MHPELDRVIWHALSGRHAAFSQGNALALRYGIEYAPFAATRDDSMPSLAALHDLIVPGKGIALFTRDELAFPRTLSPLNRARVEQMVLTTRSVVDGVPALPPAARPLEAGDIPAMTALVALTQPGPFAERTATLGRYMGVFQGDALIAMAGERMRIDGFVEISAVCTHPDHRGQGLSARLIAALARAAFDRGETPFLHVYADNTPALAVYRRLGFSVRATMHLAVLGRAVD
jgi:predicted GNAT family acetyltransferase